MDDITQAIVDGDGIEVGARRALLRFAVQRQIFCPHSAEVLDVRRAVLLDGTNHGHSMHIMTAEVYDQVKDTLFSPGHWNRDEWEVLDGRELFAKRPARTVQINIKER